ncbi:MAG: hypothetical protein KJO07_17730 [Deltaproteobacteria bacterium]|nr:hypothetical protein [Deltaproteobacteria bacterium]
MKDQLLLLVELQIIDSKIHELEAAMRALPEKLRPAKEDLARLETMLEAERAQVSDTETWEKEQRELIKREEEEVKHAKMKLQAAKNTREFAAASREVDNKRRSIAEREDEVRKVIAAIETTRTNMESHQKDVDELRSKVEEEETQIAEKVKVIETQAKEAGAGRSDITAKIEPRFLKRYERIVGKRGLAIVPVKDGVCQGCHMSLPPQLNNMLARFETIEQCATCHRLLYRSELVEDEDAEAAEA